MHPKGLALPGLYYSISQKSSTQFIIVMPKFPRLPVIVVNFVMVVSLAAIWIVFAPLQIGGQASYVMVNGISMQPGFYAGDLVIVREAQAYQAGDVVTYRNAEMGGAYVIHRIIGMEQEKYVLKGDNNSWIDSYRPTRGELIGKLWIHAPTFGTAVQWLRLPINLGITTALLGGVLMADPLIRPKQRGKGKNKPARNSGGMIELALYTLGFIALVFLGLSIFAFSRPVTRTGDNIKYQQSGVFFYSATGTPGVYDTEMVRSGEPVFTNLTCTINLGFTYNLMGDELLQVSGSQQLNAYVADVQSGWQRTIPLKAATPFQGNSYSTMAALDLCQVQALVASIEQETGFRAGTYTLTIVPHVAIAAKTAGHELSDNFESKLVFKFDKVHFYLASGGNSETDAMRSSKDSSVNNTATQINKISGLGFELSVQNLRILGLAGLGFTLVGLLALGWNIFESARRSPDALIRIKYSALLMDVYDRGFESFSPVIDVTTIDDLAKLAERQNTMILHMTRNSLHYYFVQIEGTTYRYVIGDERSGLMQGEAS